MSYDHLQGGHAPGHLREALYDWIDHGLSRGRATCRTVTVNEKERPIEWLLGRLWNCTDQLPGEVRHVLKDNFWGSQCSSVAGAGVCNSVPYPRPVGSQCSSVAGAVRRIRLEALTR